ncbi:hypothetical protein P3342_011048 [Pyrenophora teres f. teres]|uniref:HET-domain-containing protein n=1 Tax=Pyrenophora teres f. teres TaxID=97479 RepID=A0A6S6WDJ2_9PLEO|nr:hypothetical protein PTNB85_10334 [Pyrenophora teres f. teres]KAE8832080.1 hypothetical protein HRS9139_06322 [Pyrenophora teres f. teres]KAE8835187.1 hypothetical protein HRS9122_07457 [Pyrenophora teres f. teres]KAE8858085.1 hypothetical protein PTNB29_07300 [Pyrenophora teres f. teres]KAE8862077.1 hypothetical protein PTNB73_07631 [Pyrenophora teres f. teres]
MDEYTDDTDSENSSEYSVPFAECLICGDLNSGWDSEFVQTDDFVASANGKCSACEMLLRGLSLVTDIQLVTKLRFDYDAALHILCWDDSDSVTSYEFYISSSGKIDGAWSHTSRDLLSPLDERLDLAKSWLDNCLESHSRCPPIVNKLPKRLLMLGDADDDIHLYETAGERASYVALSYCWGTAGNIKTTQENLKQRLKRIHTQEIPKTILDAVHITRHFGFKYLWVDSLCIVQNDRIDWAEQAPMMSDVYNKAAFTIAAHSENVHGGCLSTDQTRNTALATFDTIIAGQSTTISIRMDTRNNGLCPAHGVNGNERSKLENRGWTLQEYFLAERILHCTNSEMAWECSSHTSCECSTESEPDYGFRIGAQEFKKLICWKPDSMQQRSYLVNKIHDMWRDVVEEFTHRSLTFSDDKLPAIAGLASAVSQAFPGILSTTDYIFGLWRKDLISHLLWCRINDGTSTERLSQNKAPSWSWASLSHGPVFYPADNSIVDWFCEQWEFIEECEILSVHCSPSTPNIFGPGTGRIRLEGKLRQITLDHICDDSRPVTSKLSSADMNLTFDVHHDAYLGQSYYVLVLGRVMRKEKEKMATEAVHGILLAKSEVEEDLFYRVGYAKGDEHPLSSTRLVEGETRRIDVI